MYTREAPWHGLGTRVEDAPNSLVAMQKSGLNWTVEPKKIAIAETGNLIPSAFANVRSSDGKVLGIVGDRYRIVQNVDAFAFTDTLIGGDVRYETAGSLNGGRRIWLLAKMPEKKVAGDEVEPFLCFTNTFDGTGAVRVVMTPVRVVCQNTLNLALRTAKRAWSVKHTGDIQKKILEARECLELADEYMDALDKRAEQLANVRVDEDMLNKILAQMFPVKETDSNCKKRNAQSAKDSFMLCYAAPDIAKFHGTAWGAVNAMADMVAHTSPIRQTQNYKENNWARIMDGHSLVDQMAQMVVAR